MFEDDFDLAKASPLIARQREVAVIALDAALQCDPAMDAEFSARVRISRDRLAADPAYRLQGDFTMSLLAQALMAWQTGAWPAALAWARCVYVVTRRIAHGWRPLLNYVIDARIFRTARIHAAPAGGDPAIPRTIIQYWDKPVPPPDVAAMIETWRRLDGYVHRLVDHLQARDFLEQYFPGRVLAAYDATTHVAGKSDVFRLAWLYRHGGIYVDADEKLAGNLVSILSTDYKSLLTWSQGQPPCISNWFIAVEPASQLIEIALMLAVKRVEYAVRSGIKMNAWLQTGPGVVSMAVLDDFALNGRPVVAQGLFLLSEPLYRRVVHSDEFLEYRKHPQGNWRMEHSEGSTNRHRH